MIGLIKVLNATSGIGTDLTLEDVKGIIDELFNDAREAIDGTGPSEAIKQIANEVSANNGSRLYGWLGSVPGVKEWLGTKVYKQLKEYNYIVRNKEWYNAISMRKKDLRRNGLIDIPMLLDGLVNEHADHKLEMLINGLINGTSLTAYDNIAFFSNATGVRVNDNLLAGTGITLATIKADIIAARVAAASFKNDNGKLMRVILDTVICPVALETTFLEIKNSTADAGGAHSGIANVAGGYIKNIIADPLLDADDVNDWYYTASGSALKPLVIQTEAMNEGDEFESVLDETKWASDGVLGYSVESASNTGYGVPALAVKTVVT